MTDRIRNILCILLCIAVLLFCIVNIGIKHIDKAKRIQELSKLHSYEVYSSYIAIRDSYYVYVMCNPEYEFSDILNFKLTDEYIESFKLKSYISETPNTICIYMMIPSEELPYGWEKNEFNISVNFDLSIFHRHTMCIITIPYGADSLEDCSIEYSKENGEW